MTAAEAYWKQMRFGRCENCGLVDDRPLHGHHIIARQTVARLGGDEWDPRNRLNLCSRCHMEHEFGQRNRKIPLSKVPARAVEFACDLMGDDLAAGYLQRHYAGVNHDR